MHPSHGLIDWLIGLITLKSLEALQGNSGGTRDELQQPRSALFIERLHSFPEPFNNVAVGRAVLQARVAFPVVDVDLPQAAHDELQAEKKRHR